MQQRTVTFYVSTVMVDVHTSAVAPEASGC